jgi:hypothetical protein
VSRVPLASVVPSTAAVHVGSDCAAALAAACLHEHISRAVVGSLGDDAAWPVASAGVINRNPDAAPNDPSAFELLDHFAMPVQ